MSEHSDEGCDESGHDQYVLFLHARMIVAPP
jgi:hypothetical protein